MKSTKYVAIITAIIAINLSYTPPINARGYINRPASMCGILSEIIVKKLVSGELPTIDPNFAFIRAGNDIQCLEPEYMANLAVIAPKDPGQYFFGIFHVHFDKHGNIISTAAFVKWNILKDVNDPYVWNS